MQVSQAAAAEQPQTAAALSALGPASAAGAMSAPAPFMARPKLGVPRASKTAPTILESIPLEDSISRGLLSTAADDAAAIAPAPAAPAPASSAADMAAFRSALAAELIAASHAAAQPGADSAQAPSPVAGAVASLAARLEAGQASPALSAQLLATQSLLEAALTVHACLMLNNSQPNKLEVFELQITSMS